MSKRFITEPVLVPLAPAKREAASCAFLIALVLACRVRVCSSLTEYLIYFNFIEAVLQSIICGTRLRFRTVTEIFRLDS